MYTPWNYTHKYITAISRKMHRGKRQKEQYKHLQERLHARLLMQRVGRVTLLLSVQ